MTTLVTDIGARRKVGLDQRSCSTLGTVTAWIGDCLLTGKPSRYVANHLGQLSLQSGTRFT